MAVPIFVVCGVWLIGLGLYFALLRPSLLPEDPRFIGSSLAQIQVAVPGLARWLNHVFNVMGGFMLGSGVLTLFLAVTAVDERRNGTGAALALTGFATVGSMSWTNFAIDSNFKWLLLVPAILWSAGWVCYAFEGRGR